MDPDLKAKMDQEIMAAARGGGCSSCKQGQIIRKYSQLQKQRDAIDLANKRHAGYNISNGSSSRQPRT